MNILLTALMYPEETAAQIAALSKNGLQNQINSYQRAFVQGLDQNLEAGERLDLLNALPVGVFPLHYRGLFLQGGMRDGRMRELGGVNLPWLKQLGRELRAAREMRQWIAQSRDNRTILIYSLYLPYLKAAARVKRRVGDELKLAVIVTDLPNQWGISSGRQGALKRMEYAMGKRKLALCRQMDGFVLLTEAMAEVLPIGDRPRLVMEGLVAERAEDALPHEPAAAPPARPSVLYTGTLNRELGIQELLDAFAHLPECDLLLCGKGDMEAQAESYAKRFPNIRYAGFVPQKEALRLQAAATLLVNPRSPSGAFTRYSFPSKTLEYMRSGKPVLCFHLQGIPGDYDDYLYYIDREGAEGIREAVRRLLMKNPQELAKRGAAGRAYVLARKNPRVQGEKLLRFLRGL